MKIGFKVRIYPNKEQEGKLFYFCKCSHEMWNYVVAKHKDVEGSVICGTYGVKGSSPQDLMKEFIREDIPKRIYNDIAKKYSQTWKRVYNKIGRPPKFHKYNPNKQSFCIASQTIKINDDNTINLSGVKKGRKCPVDMTFLNKYNIKTITEPRYTCSYGKWYVSGSCEVNVESLGKTKSQLGLDWGIKDFMTTSNGIRINYPRTVLRQFYRVNSLKSKLSKKTKGSNNHQKLKEKIDKAYFRLENLKKDFIEQTTTELARENNIAVEDLTNAKILMSNKNRRRLRIIAPLDRFTIVLEWKCKKFGRTFIKVNPAYTSMDCSRCGKRNLELTLKDRVYKCSCGLELDRDINAACNIVAKGFC